LASGLSVCKINQFLISKTSLNYTAQYIVQAPILIFPPGIQDSSLQPRKIEARNIQGLVSKSVYQELCFVTSHI